MTILPRLSLTCLSVLPLTYAADSSAAFTGQWLSKDKDMVYQASPCSSGLCVKIVGLKSAGNGEKKVESECGLQILTLTKWSEEKRRWEGEVLDPKSKKLYPATLESAKDGRPVMKAHWGVLSFSEPWSKFDGTVAPQCEIR